MWLLRETYAALTELKILCSRWSEWLMKPSFGAPRRCECCPKGLNDVFTRQSRLQRHNSNHKADGRRLHQTNGSGKDLAVNILQEREAHFCCFWERRQGVVAQSIARQARQLCGYLSAAPSDPDFVPSKKTACSGKGARAHFLESAAGTAQWLLLVPRLTCQPARKAWICHIREWKLEYIAVFLMFRVEFGTSNCPWHKHRWKSTLYRKRWNLISMWFMVVVTRGWCIGYNFRSTAASAARLSTIAGLQRRHFQPVQVSIPLGEGNELPHKKVEDARRTAWGSKSPVLVPLWVLKTSDSAT